MPDLKQRSNHKYLQKCIKDLFLFLVLWIKVFFSLPQVCVNHSKGDRAAPYDHCHGGFSHAPQLSSRGGENPLIQVSNKAVSRTET